MCIRDRGTSDAIFNNFSAIVDSSDFNAIISSSNRFGLSDLTTVALGLHKRIGTLGHFGLSITDYGFDEFSDQNVSIKYAKPLSSKLNISGEFGVNRISIEEFGSQTTVIYKLGLYTQLNKDLSFGVLISNPERISIEANTQIISALAIGIKYNVSKKARVFGEVSKEIEEDIDGRVGIEYLLHPKFCLQAGYSTLNGQSGFGFTYKISKTIILDSSVRYHSVLGLSPAISLKYTST